MTITATLVVGSDGSTSQSGNSRQISTPEDRQRFLALHRSADAIIVGGKTIEADPYAGARCPVYVFTQNKEKTFSAPFLTVHTDANNNLSKALTEISERHPHVVIESGQRLLLALIETGLVEYLELSITPITNGENAIDIDSLLKKFVIIEDVTINATRLLKCRYQGNATDR